MTSQCGSDSPDGGAVMPEIETAILPSSRALVRRVRRCIRLLTKRGLARWLRVNSA